MLDRVGGEVARATSIVRAAETTSSLPSSLAKYVAYESHLKVLRERMASRDPAGACV